MEPSRQQRDVFDFIARGEGSAIIDAVAGSGKTTTLRMSAERIRQAIAVVCFGREIKEELSRKMPRHAECLTLHSLGNRAWGLPREAIAAGGPGQPSKTERIIRMLNDRGVIPRWVPRGKLRRLVKLAKDEGIVPSELLPGSPEMLPGLVPDEEQEWLRLIDHYDLDLTDRRGELTPTACVAWAREIMRWSIRYARQVIDLDDQLYMPTLARGFSFPQRPWVFCDELQDVSALQREMILRLVAEGGRFIGVGDRNQAIFGWRGADTSSMDRVKQMTGAAELPLHVCYRCPRQVVELAQTYVPHITAADGAEEGVVEYVERWQATDLQPGTMVICRMRGPVTQLAYRLLGHGTPVRIAGGEAAASGLCTFIENLADASLSVDVLFTRLDQWVTERIAVAAAKEDEEAMQEVRDKADTVTAIAEGSRARMVGQVCEAVRTLFIGPKEGRVILGSKHSSKGLEADEVVIMDDHLEPRARLEWQKVQEKNLHYVGVTRARRRVRFARSEGLL